MILRTQYQRAFWEQIGESPTPRQQYIHELGGRFVIIGGGERGGKSRTLARHLFCHCLFDDLFWIVGPDYEQCHSEFQYVVDWLGKLDAIERRDLHQPKKGSWDVTVDWTRVPGFAEKKATHPLYRHMVEKTLIETKTASEVLALAAKAPGGVLVVEPGQIDDYNVILRLRGRVGEKRGWLWMGGTFEGVSDWYKDLWEEWQGPNAWNGQSFDLPSWSNTEIFPLGRDDPEIKKLEEVYPADLFMERFGGRPYKSDSVIFKEFERSRHVRDDIYWNPELPVEIAVDPGFNSSYAVAAIQIKPNENGEDSVFVIDTLYVSKQTGYEVVSAFQKRPWADKVRTGVIDIAGTQRQANKSQQEIWAEAGVSLDAAYVFIEDGITRHRNFLKQGRLFYSINCQGLEEYRKWERDKRTQRPKREFCDLMKAISYYLVSRFGMVENNGPRPKYKSPFSF